MKISRIVRDIWDRTKIGFALPIGRVSVSVKLRRKPPESGPARIVPQAPDRHAPKSSGPDSELPSESTQTCLIVGAGTNLGFSLARRFGAAGFRVAVARRQSDLLTPLIQELSADGIPVGGFRCDATDYASVRRMMDGATKLFGVPDCVVFNVEAYAPGTVQDISPAAFEDSWRGNCFAGFLVGQAVAQLMCDRGRGTIIFTGATASVRGKQGYINLAVGKAGLRALAQSMARELGPAGIHVCHVILDGGMRDMRPQDVADNYFHLHNQPANAWTHELDLRTSTEPW